MKFIHLTDTHVVGGGRRLYGADPVRRLAWAVDSINDTHPDADFVIVTGDLTHWGDAQAYDAFAAEIRRLTPPVHLMMGNHDTTPDFAACFPQAPPDPMGFVQFTFDTPEGRAICLDTSLPGASAGGLCQARLNWLATALSDAPGDMFLFMHHPPFTVGIRAMDDIMLQNPEAFYSVVAPHKTRIRHLFFGHLHRALWGTWRGIGFSCMRGLNHQVTLDLSGAPGPIGGDLASPAYGVVLVEAHTVIVHLHDFTDASPRFCLRAPDGQDQVAWALNMHHKEPKGPA